MKKLNKEYYLNLGKMYSNRQTITEDVSRLMDKDNNSWQAKAFREGLEGGLVANGWQRFDPAIESHLSFLGAEWRKQSLEGDKGEKRFYRIHQKIKKLCKKHGLNHIQFINGVKTAKM